MEAISKKLFLEGWIPAPDESDQEFIDRIEKTKVRLLNPRAIKDVAFDLSVPPLLIFRSKEKLPFWNGGMTWIVSFEDGARIPLVQLPPKPRRYTFSTEKEIIDHEKIHALRVAFKEPVFEEIVAYRTSPSRLRQFLGPLFTKNTEAVLFFLSMPIAIFLELPWLIPLFTALLFVRLCRRQFLFSRALHSIKTKYHRSEEVIVFLSDQEIKRAAKGDLSFFDNDSIRMAQIRTFFGVDS